MTGMVTFWHASYCPAIRLRAIRNVGGVRLYGHVDYLRYLDWVLFNPFNKLKIFFKTSNFKAVRPIIMSAALYRASVMSAVIP